jgi:hypothetical protein
MVNIELKFEGRALLDKLQKKADEVPDKLSKVLNESAFNAQDILERNAPRDTGNLAGSHRVENRGLLERIIFPDEGVAPYALFVVLGTKPHVIEGNPYLYWPGADHSVKRVNHPGTKAQPYIKESIPEIQAKIRSNLDDFKQWVLKG